MVALMLPILMSAALAQIPVPARAINAAKDARAKTEAAQKKNSDALDPPPSAGQPPQGKPPAAPPSAPPPPSTPPAAPAGEGTPPAGAAGPPAQPAGPGYSYDPAGRRDPFVSLLGRGGDLPTTTGSRPAGLPGLLVNEVNLKGVLKANKGEFLALLQAPDNHTYVVHAGDKLLDGVVKAITQDSVVFSQDVNDPLSLVKQREVRKTIRAEGR
jgi:Tfp pilus assembly protein PilP